VSARRQGSWRSNWAVRTSQRYTSSGGCARTSGGGVKCWGYNRYGQLGNATTTDSGIAVDVTGASSGINAIAVGAFHACVITTGGAVRCWGAHYAGQLGDGTSTDSPTPVDVDWEYPAYGAP
jgi:alpha-tubulin suppressor-like RCC1 family protein